MSGLLIPIGIICIYLISNDAFVFMLDQVFPDTSYNGSSPLDIMFMPFLPVLKDYYVPLLLLFVAAMLYYVLKHNIIKKGAAAIKWASVVVIGIAFISLFDFYIRAKYKYIISFMRFYL